MRRMTVAVVGAMLAACVACTNDTAVDDAQRRGDETTDMRDMGSTREASGPANQAVTLEGCLQRGGGTFTRGYLLTMVNSPSTAGTAGSVTATGSSVERQQMRMAATTYRLAPKDDVTLDDKIGKRVRVNGTVTEQADVPNGQGAIGSDSDTQQPNRDRNSQRDRDPQLEVTDLAQVEVTSAAVIGDSCASTQR